MKTKFMLLIATATMLTFTSCKKCYKCQELGGTYTEEICKPSGYSQSEWKEYVEQYETDNGMKCD